MIDNARSSEAIRQAIATVTRSCGIFSGGTRRAVQLASHTYIGLIERGERSLSQIIAKALDIAPNRLFEDLEAPSGGGATRKKRAKTVDKAANLATIRQILIEANLVDPSRYEQQLLKEHIRES